MKAVKGNKEYTITQTEKKAYQDRGFDILDNVGGVIAYGRGKTVPYGEHAELKAELEAVKKENATLKAKDASEETSDQETDAKTKATKKKGE